jgi:hypothetical protein
LKHYQFASSLAQWNFINNGTLKGNENENPIYHAPFVIFQRYKIIILTNCDTPYGPFYYVCTM